MSKILFKLLYVILWIITLLPLRVLYLFSDFFYLIVYYLIPYRKNVVLNNLKKAFPEKTDEEIVKISKSFYRYFCDFLIESIKSINFSIKRQAKRCTFKNVEVLNDQYDKGNNIVLVSGHYGNWEWFNLLDLYIKHQFIYAAKVQSNTFSDKLINDLRQKYGAVFVKMEDTYKTVISKVKNQEKILIWLLADQRPPQNAEFWTTFLNQDTAFYLGAAKMVKKLGFSLVFMDNQRIGRGKYETTFELLCEGKTELDIYELTEIHVRKLEEEIIQRPEFWLWSHKRWKYTKPEKSTN